MDPPEYELLSDFLYEAIFQRDENNRLPREIIQEPALRIYIEDFGEKKHDHCLCAVADDVIVIPAGVNGFPVGGIVFLAPPEKILPVISQAQEIFTVSFHLGKPFMGDDRLVFQIGQQGIHIVLKRGKTGFPQIFF